MIWELISQWDGCLNQKNLSLELDLPGQRSMPCARCHTYRVTPAMSDTLTELMDLTFTQKAKLTQVMELFFDNNVNVCERMLSLTCVKQARYWAHDNVDAAPTYSATKTSARNDSLCTLAGCNLQGLLIAARLTWKCNCVRLGRYRLILIIYSWNNKTVMATWV